MKKKKIIALISCLFLATLLFIPEVNALILKTDAPMVDICESKSMMKVLYMIKVGFTVAKIAIPVILIATISLDIYNLITDPGNSKKVVPVVKKRLIAAVLVFFVPTIISVLLSSMGEDNRVSTCWNHAEPEYFENLEN